MLNLKKWRLENLDNMLREIKADIIIARTAIERLEDRAIRIEAEKSRRRKAKQGDK